MKEHFAYNEVSQYQIDRMPAKDVYHDAVKQAPVKDGWTILKENYELEYGGDSLFPNLAAERSIAALRGQQRILVEIKSFLGRSFISDLQSAIGQYLMYQDVLRAQSLDFTLYLAVPQLIYQDKFQTPLAQLIVGQQQINLLVFNADQETVEQWISRNFTEN